ncbi:hypothetical protein ACM92K_001966 [Cronobacter turicensis]|uniref:hypothetical protein n=1 Tax=unclassified Cronobacter TaxID=2649764 RepID=UPI0013EDBE86|nr:MULTISPECIES: hypothetical protein [unclassified Cronobacter]ELQ6223741.1 hypothetical protein [Cronobacter turicensis]ELY4853172.1 hypothetical protein [Cronobacter turicensis]KAF6595682.1 hypothetical protein G9G39_08350 [Cronobacter sp. EKM101R]KAF6600358.1 hypothetical protein G9G38_01405 [Cronobacter sp. EKM102R]
MFFSLFKNAAIVRRSLLPGYTENAPGGFDKFRQSKCANRQSGACATEKNGENRSENASFSHRYFRTTLPLAFFTARTAQNIPSGSNGPRMIL